MFKLRTGEVNRFLMGYYKNISNADEGSGTINFLKFILKKKLSC